MDNQAPQQIQVPEPILTAPPPVVVPQPKHKILKKVALFVGVILVIFSLLAWYGSYLEKQDKKMASNAQNISSGALTAEKIKNLNYATNVGTDYFKGSPEVQNKIVDKFVQDNSESDSIYLYIAANTAYKLNRPKDAMFLLFAAQIRKSFDYKRFDLGAANGNNIQTYLGYLNEGAAQNINPLAIQDPKLFSEAIRMIERWSVIPASDAYYPKQKYGDAKLPKDQWHSAAQSKKESFLNDFAYSQEKVLNDPKGLEASRFVSDYNLNKVSHNAANDKKYQDALDFIDVLSE